MMNDQMCASEKSLSFFCEDTNKGERLESRKQVSNTWHNLGKKGSGQNKE